jgi:DNA (cytosine-5)-methyltransferase 1
MFVSSIGPVTVTAMKAVSLFTGAGGLDLGCEAAGFVTVATVEHNPTARKTLELNRASWFPSLEPDAMLDDIVDLDFGELLRRAGLEPGEADLVHGGPPCTPFSKSGYWLAYKRAGNDPKASLLDNYVDALEVIRPKAFLMENVYGLAYGNQNRAVLERFIRRIRDAGYSFDRKVLTCSPPVLTG